MRSCGRILKSPAIRLILQLKYQDKGHLVKASCYNGPVRCIFSGRGRFLMMEGDMGKEKDLFVTIHYVDENYHRRHPQMIHRHDDVLELLYIMEGGGSYHVRDHEYLVQPGNMIICNAGTFHGEAPSQGKNMISYCCVMKNIRRPELPENTLTAREELPVLYFTEERQELESIFYTLYDLHGKSAMYHSTCEHLSRAILDIVLNKLQKRSRVNDQTKTQNNELVVQISDYLDSHFMKDVTLDELEQVFHISKYAISHIFKNETGLSPIRYVMLRRIGEAQNLLMNTSLPIGDIGESLGFNDNSHFSTTFKKYIGTTPGAYRKHFQTVI